MYNLTYCQSHLSYSTRICQLLVNVILEREHPNPRTLHSSLWSLRLLADNKGSERAGGRDATATQSGLQKFQNGPSLPVSSQGEVVAILPHKDNAKIIHFQIPNLFHKIQSSLLKTT